MSETPSYQRFLAELKRRHVFRVAAVYGATSFVVLQVADLLQEALHLPGAFLTGITVLALLGLPLAIVLAWAFDKTPEGLARTGAATTREIQEIVAQPPSSRWPSGILALIGVAALALASWMTFFRGTPENRDPARSAAAGSAVATPNRTPADASIAVLPFSNLSGAEETQPFVEGLHDDLLTQLSKIGALTVISRTSVQEYRETTKNVKEIAEELGVATILEGGVQRAGDRYRINVQLIDADTDAHLWAEQYSGELTTANIFEVQSQIATSITEALQANLTASEIESLGRLPTDDLEAYELYQGALGLHRSGDEPSFRAADLLVSRAIEHDSSFAEAYALKAIIGTQLYWYYFDRSDSIAVAADDLSRHALSLAPDLPEGHAARGHYHYRVRLDYDRAQAETELALHARPGDADFVWLAGDILRRKGDFRGALSRYQRAYELAPRDANVLSAVAQTHCLLREYERAEALSRRALELDPALVSLYYEVAWCRVVSSGDTAGARQVLEDGVAMGLRPGAERFGFGELAMLERDPDAAIAAFGDWQEGVSETQFEYVPRSLAIGFAFRLKGDSASARTAFDSARALLEVLVEQDPTEPRYRSSLGLALAGLGRSDDAIREGEEGVRLMPPEREAWRGAFRVADLARIYALTGHADEAIDRLEFLLSVPSDWSAWELRLNPAWDPLRGDPRFEALAAVPE